MGMAELYRELPWQHAGARKNGGKHFRKVGDFQRKCLTISDIIIMISDMKTTQIAHKIAQLKQELAELGPMHPGSLSEQYNVCGKPGCRCSPCFHLHSVIRTGNASASEREGGNRQWRRHWSGAQDART